MFDWWIRMSAEREVRRLNKDARAIVEMTDQGYSAPSARAAAVQTREYLQQAHELAVGDPPNYDRFIDEYRRLHRDARDHHNQIKLTSLTLAIIYLRSEKHGAACAPARQAIDAFLARWAHVTEETTKET